MVVKNWLIEEIFNICLFLKIILARANASTVKYAEVKNLSIDEKYLVLALPIHAFPCLNEYSPVLDRYYDSIDFFNRDVDYSDKYNAKIIHDEERTTYFWVANDFAIGTNVKEFNQKRCKTARFRYNRPSIRYSSYMYHLKKYHKRTGYTGCPMFEVSGRYYVRKNRVSKDKFTKELALWLLKTT